MPEIPIEYTSRMKRLLEVCTNLISNLDLEPFLQSIIEVAAGLTQSESCAILVYDNNSQNLRFAAAPFFVLKSLQATTIPINETVAGWVFTNQQVIAINDVRKDKRYQKISKTSLEWAARSILAVPLIFKGKAIGVLEVFNKILKASYTEEDIQILETLASQAAVAIQNQNLLQEAQESYRKVIELNRVKSDFIAIASHELRTPLGLVLGHASLLQEMVGPSCANEIEIIIRNSLQLKDIFEQLSNIDQLEQGSIFLRRARFSITDLISLLVEQLSDLAVEKKIKLSVDIPPRQLFVEGDEGRMAIALRNLIKNAIIFTNAHGKVRIRAEEVPGYIKISVIDNGIGIPANDQEKIFERFFQVEKHLTRKHGGMGLGLAIAREMIQMHGGRIWVESIEGKGSRFSFLLPLNAAQVDAAQRVFKV